MSRLPFWKPFLLPRTAGADAAADAASSAVEDDDCCGVFAAQRHSQQTSGVTTGSELACSLSNVISTTSVAAYRFLSSAQISGLTRKNGRHSGEACNATSGSIAKSPCLQRSSWLSSDCGRFAFCSSDTHACQASCHALPRTKNFPVRLGLAPNTSSFRTRLSSTFCGFWTSASSLCRSDSCSQRGHGEVCVDSRCDWCVLRRDRLPHCSRELDPCSVLADQKRPRDDAHKSACLLVRNEVSMHARDHFGHVAGNHRIVFPSWVLCEKEGEKRLATVLHTFQPLLRDPHSLFRVNGLLLADLLSASAQCFLRFGLVANICFASASETKEGKQEQERTFAKLDKALFTNICCLQHAGSGRDVQNASPARFRQALEA